MQRLARASALVVIGLFLAPLDARAIDPQPAGCAAAEARWVDGLRTSSDRAAVQRFINETPTQCAIREAAVQRLAALRPSPRQARTTPDPDHGRRAELRDGTVATWVQPDRERAGHFEFNDCDSGDWCPAMVATDLRVGVSKYEVTFAQWDACVTAGGCNGYRPGDEGWGRGNRPVINVSWSDAQAYVQWLSQRTGQRYRLLTEAEWEYAARAGTTTNFSWGDQDPVCEQSARNGANFNACTDDRTRPVGSFQPNGFGLYDVHGNVAEWVEDCWEASCSVRVLRGDGWMNGPERLRFAYRDSGATPTSRSSSYGFRVARSASGG